MSAPTPGPWIVETRAAHPNHAGSFSVTAANDGVVICGRMGWPSNVEESHANARLIGAVPDLLAAAQAGGRYCDALRPHQDAGASGTIIHDAGELERLFVDWYEKTRAALAKADGR